MDIVTVVILIILSALVLFLIFRPAPSGDGMIIATHSTEKLDPEDVAYSMRLMFPTIGIMVLNQMNQVNDTLLFKYNTNATPKKNMFIHSKEDASLERNYYEQITGQSYMTLYIKDAIIADKRYYKLEVTGKPLIYRGIYSSILLALDVIDSNGPLRIYNYTKPFLGYLKADSAKACYSVFTHIASAGGRFIIMGDFNLAGGIWSQIVKRIFGSTVIHSWVPGLITCNDYDGIAAPDGIIISTNVAKSARFGVREMAPSPSLQHNVLYAEIGGSGKYLDKVSARRFDSGQIGQDRDWTTIVPEWTDDWIDITVLNPQDTSKAVPTIKLENLFNTTF